MNIPSAQKKINKICYAIGDCSTVIIPIRKTIKHFYYKPLSNTYAKLSIIFLYDFRSKYRSTNRQYVQSERHVR